MSAPIKVLDHGFVRLVSYMQPAEQVEDWTGDLEIVRNARNSYNAAWRTGEDAGKDAKLIHRLTKDWHTSPFESMVFTFEAKLPIFAARQWHRHRTWAYSEVSARYAELPEEFYIPDIDKVGVQSKDNKQARDIGLERAAGVDEAAAKFIYDLQCHSELGFALYREHLAAGVPRELARCFLGLNTYTHMFGTVSLHNLFGFLRLRLHSHAQYEIQVYAQALLQLIEPVVPVCVEAAKEYRLGAA